MMNIARIDTQADLEARLRHLEEEMIAELTSLDLDIVEGKVMSRGPAPYRRLDCGHCALAYLRRRPSKRAVRVDISGMWNRPRWNAAARARTASSMVTIMVRSVEDLDEAVAFLRETVLLTRMPERLGLRSA